MEDDALIRLKELEDLREQRNSLSNKLSILRTKRRNEFYKQTKDDFKNYLEQNGFSVRESSFDGVIKSTQALVATYKNLLIELKFSDPLRQIFFSNPDIIVGVTNGNAKNEIILKIETELKTDFALSQKFHPNVSPNQESERLKKDITDFTKMVDIGINYSYNQIVQNKIIKTYSSIKDVVGEVLKSIL